MGKRLVTAQRPFRLLVAALREGSDPSRGTVGNPTVQINTYLRQSFPEVPGRGPECQYQGIRGTTTRLGLLAGTPAGGSATITVASAAFLGTTSILIGRYTLTAGVDFAVDAASTANTATNLQTAIDALPGYSASVLGSDVTVTGPRGPIGNEVVLKATGVSPANFTITTFSGALPAIGAPTIT